VNLHRFWDADVLARRHLGAERYAQRLEAALTATPAARAHDPPAAGAAESLVPRPTVYAFAPAIHSAAALDDGHLAKAQTVAEQRLVLAGARLAATLNTMFCGPGAR